MPNLRQEDIQKAAYHLLCAGGASDENAQIVSSHMAGANLAGHDSHGLIRTMQYLKDINIGRIDPKARPEIVKETSSTAHINGNAAFGQVAATIGTELAIEKARESGISLVALSNLDHTGRIGTYPEMASREGMAAIMCTGYGADERVSSVAPFGGREGRMGTNPLSMSFPYKPDAPILLDFATSMTAEGKLRVARAKGVELPDYWVLDKDGVPSRDPNDYYDGGVILPLGGLTGGHKGHSLNFLVTLLGVVIGELGFDGRKEIGHRNGTSIIVIDLNAMAPSETVNFKVNEIVEYVKSSPPLEGSRGVLYPGEIEAETRRDRKANGIPVDETTWSQIVSLIKEHKLDAEFDGLL